MIRSDHDLGAQHEKAEDRSRRTVAAPDRSRRQSADHRLFAGGGRSLQVASRYGGSRRSGGHGLEDSIPDASGAGLRCRDQDAIDDRMARAGVIVAFGISIYFFFLDLVLASGGLARSAAFFPNRIARRFAVRFRIAMSAAAISAMALMPSASWASFRFSLVSLSSAALFGSSFIGCLRIRRRASSCAGPCIRSYHASARQRRIFKPHP